VLNLTNIVKQKYILFVFVLFVFLLGLGYSTTFNSLDPDFGWHLKTGQLILERGVPKVDWYTYTMPHFPWIDHEWLTDVIIYKIYSLFGYQILLLAFLTIFTLAFVVLTKRARFFYYLLPVVLGYLALLGFLGIRPQLLTVFFFAGLLVILERFLQNPYTRLVYICPIIFLVWTNLHGGFVIGLVLIFLLLLLEIFKKTKMFRKLILSKLFYGQNIIEESRERSNRKIKILSLLLIISAVITILNPYGPRIYIEIFSSIGDSFLKSHISEWVPLFVMTPSLGLIFRVSYLVMFLSFFVVFRKKVEFNNFVLVLIFFVFALLSRRNLLIFIVLTIPIFTELIFYFRKEVLSGETSRKMLEVMFGGFKKWAIALIVLGWFILGSYPYIVNNLRNGVGTAYPVQAVKFLKTLPLSDNLLNEYGWGGYLIWRLPERKVFIDGRMPSWRASGAFVFGDYVKMMEAQNGTEDLLKKYDIKIAILNRDIEAQATKYSDYQNKPKNRIAIFLEKHSWISKIIGAYPPHKNIYNELIDFGWHVAYEDNAVIILKK